MALLAGSFTMKCTSSAEFAAPPSSPDSYLIAAFSLDLRQPRVIDSAELAEHTLVQDPHISPPKVAPQDPLPRGLLVQTLEDPYFRAVSVHRSSGGTFHVNGQGT